MKTINGLAVIILALSAASAQLFEGYNYETPQAPQFQPAQQFLPAENYAKNEQEVIYRLVSDSSEGQYTQNMNSGHGVHGDYRTFKVLQDEGAVQHLDSVDEGYKPYNPHEQVLRVVHDEETAQPQPLIQSDGGFGQQQHTKVFKVLGEEQPGNGFRYLPPSGPSYPEEPSQYHPEPMREFNSQQVNSYGAPVRPQPQVLRIIRHETFEQPRGQPNYPPPENILSRPRHTKVLRVLHDNMRPPMNVHYRPQQPPKVFNFMPHGDEYHPSMESHVSQPQYQHTKVLRIINDEVHSSYGSAEQHHEAPRHGGPQQFRMPSPHHHHGHQNVKILRVVGSTKGQSPYSGNSLRHPMEGHVKVFRVVN